ncbi:MAG TPA: DUF4097 family beta strand repeat-containing protein [Anaerolineales bacterium]|nr:DUF4097 family beta strand repeat-containing protein [Anaerolineales bacterium]
MNKTTISTSATPDVTIEQVQGELQVRGWEHSEVLVKANPENLSLDEQDDVVHLSSRGACKLSVPHGTKIQIEKVGGNASLKLLEGSLTIDQVKGSLNLREVARTEINTINGDLSAQGISGNLHVNQVNGNAAVREVQGECALDEVSGNLVLRQVDGNIKVAAKGNARVRLTDLAGDDYHIHAGGNLHCRIPEDANVRINLVSGAKSIKVKLPDERKSYQEEQGELILGDGDIQMDFSCDGNLFLASCEGGWTRTGDGEFDYGKGTGVLPDDFSQQIAQQVETQIEAQMEAVTQQLDENMASLSQKIEDAGMTPEQTERIMRQAHEASERGIARAREKMRLDQEKLERRLEIAQRRAKVQGVAPGRETRFSQPQTPEPISGEERLAILHMLEQKKISVEEAEKLFAALEG